jgi:hypothetical protein
MKNLNPLYEWTAPVAPGGAWLFTGPTSAPENLWQAGASYALGAGSKYLKDTRLIKRIMSEYPDPMSFKNALYRMPGNSQNKQILLAKLQPNTSRQEYVRLLRKYVCHGTLFRYLGHAYLGNYSGIGNAIDAADNEMKSTQDAILTNI